MICLRPARALVWLMACGACALTIALPPPARAIPNADKLVILSTTDVMGKTGPCGCHIPKGGLARQVGFVDSMKAGYGQVLWVDNGGYFPEHDSLRAAAPFLMGAMKTYGTDAVGIGERDLRYGAARLVAQIQRVGLPVVCANLIDRGTKRPMVLPSMIKRIGDVQVGIFGLLGVTADLGPAKDSLSVLDPAIVARRTVAELRGKGADVIVLLSQLGRNDGDSLVSSVEGIDAVVAGHNVRAMLNGQTIKHTVVCYGGEQGQYMCRTVLTLDGRHRVTSGEADAVTLGPGVTGRPDAARLVKSFEDSMSPKQVEAAAGQVGNPATKAPGGTAEH